MFELEKTTEQFNRLSSITRNALHVEFEKESSTLLWNNCNYQGTQHKQALIQLSWSAEAAVHESVWSFVALVTSPVQLSLSISGSACCRHLYIRTKSPSIAAAVAGPSSCMVAVGLWIFNQSPRRIYLNTDALNGQHPYHVESTCTRSNTERFWTPPTDKTQLLRDDHRIARHGNTHKE